MAVSVIAESDFSLETPEILFQGEYFSSVPFNIEGAPCDIGPDGTRFLLIKAQGSAGDESTAGILRKINIVPNWFEELKKRVPAK